MKHISLFLLGFSLFFFSAQSVFAGAPHLIISDQDLTDSDSMSVSRLDTFLKTKGALGGMSFLLDGVQKTSAEIIDTFARQYQISQKYLLARIQVEQALITDSAPGQYQLDWATGFGRCDNCSEEQAAEYKGFSNQVKWAAKRVRESYLADLESGRPTISGWKKGQAKQTLDGVTIVPENNATAALYTYTPWAGKLFGGDPNVGGNGLFHKIFTEWFGIKYTDGALLQDVETGGIYLIKNGKKQPFVSRAAFFTSYDIKKVIIVSKNVLDNYDTGPVIKFPDFVLLRSPKGTVYLYQQGIVRGIQSPDVLKKIGFNPEEIIDASWSDIHSFTEGAPITADDIFPAGVLLQYKENGGIVYVDPEGVRHPIPAREILKIRFPNRSIIQKPAAEIDQFPLGKKLLFRDGELLTSPNSKTVYVIAKGQKRPFDSAETFKRLGYKWNNIISVPQATLDLHPTGAKIKLEN